MYQASRVINALRALARQGFVQDLPALLVFVLHQRVTTSPL